MSDARESASEIAARLKLRRSGNAWSGDCPACGYTNGLRLSQRDGGAVWWCASCSDRGALTAAVLGVQSASPPRTPARPDTSAADGDRVKAALRFWDECGPPGQAVETYLRGRGLALPAAAPIRFMPEAKHPCGRRMPCMVALLTDAAGRPLGVHRTFLAPGGAGKAAAEPVRMTLGTTRGVAVRLHQAAERVVIGEGLETTLAASALLRMPGWAAVSAGNLGDSLQLPPSIREVMIAADHDEPGQRAAQRAAARWKAEGRVVRVATPDKKGSDFNDVLRERLPRG